MFYQTSFSPQVKRWTIITYKYGKYELPIEFPSDIKPNNLGNKEILPKLPKFHKMIP